MQIKLESIVGYLIMLVLAYFTLFGHMETLAIRIYDEARLAINAYEMSVNGNCIVTHFDWQPDMWNTKPPLMVWCQAICIKIFGVRELSVRLPSAISAFVLCVFLILFSVRYVKSSMLGFFAVWVLLTSYGYIHVHAVRTGDYDSMLALFIVIYSFSFFLYCETDSLKFLYFSFAALTLAVLTKGIAGLFMVPVLFLYILYRRRLYSVLKLKQLYICIGLFIICVGGYYLFRELQNPGYLRAVWENELGGRYFEVNEGHSADFMYYITLLRVHHYSYWFYLVPIGILVGLFQSDRRIKRLSVFTGMSIAVFTLVISVSQTKLEWYAVPLYPFLAVAVSVLFYSGIMFIKRVANARTLLFRIIVMLSVIAVFYRPTYKTLKLMIPPREYAWDEPRYDIAYLLKSVVAGRYNVDGYTVLHDGYCAHLLFYVRILQSHNVDISLFGDWHNIPGNQNVIVYQDEVKQFVEHNFYFEIVGSYNTVTFYRLMERK